MSTRWDLSAYNKQNNLVLVVETKTKLGVSQSWAAQLRRNILAHGTLPNAPYFLMAFPDKFFLWVNTQDTREAEIPTYEIDSHPHIEQYFNEVGVSMEQITGASFELIIAAWLNNIMQLEESEIKKDATSKWLLESGLYHTLVGGHLDYEVMV